MDLKIKTEKEEFHGRTCGIIKQENKFLIMRVNKTSYYHIPGGHIEIGEDSKQAVISTPSVIGKNGVYENNRVTFDEVEKLEFEKSVNKIKKKIKKMK